MKKIFIELVRSNFLKLNKTKKDCQQYMNIALEKNGFKEIKDNEISEHVDFLSEDFDEILSLIKEQELSIEKKTTYLLFPKFFIRNLFVNKKIKSMEKKFNDFVKEKSDLSFEDSKKIINK